MFRDQISILCNDSGSFLVISKNCLAINSNKCVRNNGNKQVKHDDCSNHTVDDPEYPKCNVLNAKVELRIVYLITEGQHPGHGEVINKLDIWIAGLRKAQKGVSEGEIDNE